MKRIILFALLFAAIKVAGQTTGYLRYDTVKIMKQNGSCELYIINKTKDSLGILTNVGGGLTQFKKPRVLNDSTLIIGNDTLVISGAVSVTPGGSNTQFQYNNNGAFGGTTGMTWDNVNGSLLLDGSARLGNDNTTDTVHINSVLVMKSNASVSPNERLMLRTTGTSNENIELKMSGRGGGVLPTLQIGSESSGINGIGLQLVDGAMGITSVGSQNVINMGGTAWKPSTNGIMNLGQSSRSFARVFTQRIIMGSSNAIGDFMHVGTANKAFRWYYDSTTEAMRLNMDAGVKLGIATSAPAATLHVNGTSMFTDTLTGTGKVVFNGTAGDFLPLVKVIVKEAGLGDNPMAIRAIDSSTGGGYAIHGTSLNNIGVLGSGTSIGVNGTSVGGIGLQGSVQNSLTTPAVQAISYGTNSLGNTVIPGMNIRRGSMVGGIADGAGVALTFQAPYVSGGLTWAGPVDANKIESVVTDVNGISYTTDMQFKGMKDSVSDTYLTLKGGGQLQFNKYGINTFAGTPAYSLGVDASGNIIEFSPASSPTTLYSGDGTLASDRTVSTGGFTTTWSGSNDNEAVFSVSNTGTTSASAISASATGTTSTGVTGTSNSYIGVFGTSTSSTGVQGQSSSGVGIIGVSSTGAAIRGQNNPASTNAIENVLTLLRTTSAGAGANGIGAAIQYELETATSGNSQTAGSLAFKWSDATSATRTSMFEVYGVNSAVSARKFAVAGSGQLTLDNYGLGTFTGTNVSYLATTSTGAVVEQAASTIPLISTGTAAPATTPGKVGDIYVDTTNKKLYFATGTASSADWTIAN